ncbi:MAG: aspartate kinase [Phycisphaerales bacterium]|nr:MAG: aspartate kinase [Phycisphaerales bacterium]
MSLVVQKFGGTSLGDAQKIHRAARRAIQARLDGADVVMVVSAMGGTTDKLIDLAREVTPRPPRRELDMLLTTGEQVSIALMAMAIDTAGHRAISLTGGQLGLVTDSVHTQARIQRISKDRLARELSAGNIVIVAGFQGIDERGEITTLGRGASDTTAAALAAVLDADVCEIYTDVDGVYTSDPRIVPQARKLSRIGYDEMLELAGAGAKVMHSRAIEFGKKYNVPIHVRSSLIDLPGTMIMAETPGMEDVVVRGVTLQGNLATVVMIGVPNTPGTASSIFAEVARHNIVVDDIVQNIYDHGRIANIGFSTQEHEVERVREICEAMARERGFGKVEVDENVCKVSVVGIGMRSHAGVASKVFSVLAEARINIHTISTSEIVIGCIVNAEDGHRAMQHLHEAFGLDQEDPPASSG